MALQIKTEPCDLYLDVHIESEEPTGTAIKQEYDIITVKEELVLQTCLEDDSSQAGNTCNKQRNQFDCYKNSTEWLGETENWDQLDLRADAEGKYSWTYVKDDNNNKLSTEKGKKSKKAKSTKKKPNTSVDQKNGKAKSGRKKLNKNSLKVVIQKVPLSKKGSATYSVLKAEKEEVDSISKQDVSERRRDSKNFKPVIKKLPSEKEARQLAVEAVKKSNDPCMPEKLKNRKQGYRHVFSCDQCNMVFPRRVAFSIHMNKHAGLTPYQCTHCEKSFRDPHYLRIHMRVHTESKPYVCTVCEKAFRQASHLRTHMNIHTNSRPYECPTCKKRFTQTSHLRSHQRFYHDREKPYACTECDQRFSYSNHLRNHMRTHDGKRPYKCPHCDERFTQTSAIPRHVRSVHTKESLATCKVCSKEFFTTSELHQHERYAHKRRDQEFECEFCDKMFCFQGPYERHLRTKHSESTADNRLYRCGTCPKRFISQGHLRRHVEQFKHKPKDPITYNDYLTVDLKPTYGQNGTNISGRNSSTNLEENGLDGVESNSEEPFTICMTTIEDTKLPKAADCVEGKKSNKADEADDNVDGERPIQIEESMIKAAQNTSAECKSSQSGKENTRVSEKESSMSMEIESQARDVNENEISKV